MHSDLLRCLRLTVPARGRRGPLTRTSLLQKPFGLLGALVSIHDRDRSEAGSRWLRCSADVGS